ncbi:cell surface protein [Carnobacterium divergens]|uniref:WxL domain-containing protein n=1 Tax=Carnobacterium divergens TaxID=2748 RepID=UPI000D4D3E68|nr:WxL domain-containing protein [Carnobacterium divergens]MCO6018970.1 WxL domain-containing protein [Carnobacterium divergens]TFI63720.1 cell surface protein [Carnobacterium divergens]TFI90883.1 cell surface protein [Carnobacterium divergens]TFJ05750.1 cell surface protein [Carnobacterium divergens]TFJ07398.1 cell surface protein [Carnobacterium divergens]
MNKRFFLTALIISIPMAGGLQVSAASPGISDSKIDFLAGDGVVTPPVNPKEPDNLILPSPIDSSDPENEGTGQIGPLSVDYVSNLKFGKQKISGKTVAYKALNADPFVQVTDLRGSGDGWRLSAKMSRFINENNHELKGATLSMQSSIVKAGSTSNISLSPVSSDIVFDNQESKPVIIATNKGGRGTWLNVWSGADQANESIQLNVLAGTPEANTEYTSSITWELEDAPK